MITTVLRLKSVQFDLEEFLRYSRWKPIRYWLEGQKDTYRHTINRNSGFNLDIAKSRVYSRSEVKKHVAAINQFIKRNEQFFKKLKRNKRVSMCIDIGIIGGKRFMLEVSLEGEILKLVNRYNIELVVSFYP